MGIDWIFMEQQFSLPDLELITSIIGVMICMGLVYWAYQRPWNFWKKWLIELFPWLFVLWFTLGLVGCYSAVANIGTRASDVSEVLLTGIIAGPIGFVIALWLRNIWRKKN